MIRITREQTFVGNTAGFGATVSLDAEEERWLVESGQAEYVEPEPVVVPEIVPEPEPDPEPEPEPEMKEAEEAAAPEPKPGPGAKSKTRPRQKPRSGRKGEKGAGDADDDVQGAAAKGR